jgi:ABC-type antimicrobial peptide transport system permease subunit
MAARGWRFQVAPNDPLTLGIVVAALALVAIVAGLIPARRALAVDAVTSLRAE